LVKETHASKATFIVNVQVLLTRTLGSKVSGTL
jgi:hypothetical protein